MVDIRVASPVSLEIRRSPSISERRTTTTQRVSPNASNGSGIEKSGENEYRSELWNKQLTVTSHNETAPAKVLHNLVIHLG